VVDEAENIGVHGLGGFVVGHGDIEAIRLDDDLDVAGGDEGEDRRLSPRISVSCEAVMMARIPK
jgi:hypothetical protein